MPVSLTNDLFPCLKNEGKTPATKKGNYGGTYLELIGVVLAKGTPLVSYSLFLDL